MVSESQTQTLTLLLSEGLILSQMNPRVLLFSLFFFLDYTEKRKLQSSCYYPLPPSVRAKTGTLSLP